MLWCSVPKSLSIEGWLEKSRPQSLKERLDPKGVPGTWIKEQVKVPGSKLDYGVGIGLWVNFRCQDVKNGTWELEEEYKLSWWWFIWIWIRAS